jgi:hypothetical protein
MDWFPVWLETHIERHALISLPPPHKARAMYEAWNIEFTRIGLTFERADAASLELMKRGKHFKSEHYSMLLAVVNERAGGVNSARADVEAASVDCPYCQGSGRAAVVDSLWNAEFAACCICPSGRFYFASWSRNARPLDLHEVLKGRRVRVVRAGRVYSLAFRLVCDPSDFADDRETTGREFARLGLTWPGLEEFGKIPQQPKGRSNAQDLPASAARRDEDARRDHPRALPAHPHAAKPALDRPPVRAGG